MYTGANEWESSGINAHRVLKEGSYDGKID
jgi:hypothetical protein